MIEGIDISHWQGQIDWAKAKAKGVGFAIIRAGSIDNTTGVCYTDYQFENNIKGAEAQGIPYALYWFFRPNHSAVKQAEYFLALAEKANLGTMAIDLWCDIEVAGRADVVLAFCERLDLDYATGIYTNPNTALYLLTGDKTPLARFPLWLADWSAPANVPKPWLDWDIWQYGVLQDGLEYGCQSKGLDHNQAQEWMIVPPVVPPEPHTHPEIAQLQADVLSLKASHNDVVDDLTEINNRLTALTARVAALEAAPPPASGAIFGIGSSTANAHYYTSEDKAGKPIMRIYPSDSKDDQSKRVQWKPQSYINVDPIAVVGTGGHRFFRVLGYSNPELYVRFQDGVLTVGG